MIRNPWSPTQTSNGWWPKLSPDGRYVAYGNDDVWVADLLTGQEYHIGSGRPMGWYDSTRLFINEEITQLTANIFEVRVGTWAKEAYDATATLAIGNVFEARDYHWATWLAAGMRVARDNAVLRSGDAQGLDLADDGWLVVLQKDTGYLLVYENTTLSRTIIPRIPVNFFAIGPSGYVTYGQGSAVYLSPPSGADYLLTQPSGVGWVAPAGILTQGGYTWVWTVAEAGSASYAVARTVGEGSPVSIQLTVAGPLWSDVVASSTEWIFAGVTNVGGLAVYATDFVTPGTPVPSLPDEGDGDGGALPTPGSWGAIPTGLGVADKGFLLRVPDYDHLLRWSGSIWEDVAGVGNCFFQDFAVAPGGTGWSQCNGQETTYLVLNRATLVARRFRLPDERVGVYHKSAAAFSPTVVSGTVGGTASGWTSEEGAHTHLVEAAGSAISGHGTAHKHMVTTTGGDPPHVNVRRYFRR